MNWKTFTNSLNISSLCNNLSRFCENFLNSLNVSAFCSNLSQIWKNFARSLNVSAFYSFDSSIFWAYCALLPRAFFLLRSFEWRADYGFLSRLCEESRILCSHGQQKLCVFVDRVSLQTMWRGLLLKLWYHDKVRSREYRERAEHK